MRRQFLDYAKKKIDFIFPYYIRVLKSRGKQSTIFTIVFNSIHVRCHGSTLPSVTMHYNTRLSEAKALLSSYKKDCGGITADSHPLKDDRRCRLALGELPKEVYDRDWDVIMIDAPRGYFPSAPGRMGVIYSAAVMARGRKKAGVTHVFLHDVDREVEKLYAKEFLCMKYRVGGIRRLWHFVIPPAVNVTDTALGFCA